MCVSTRFIQDCVERHRTVRTFPPTYRSVAEWMPLEDLQRLLAMVDVFESLPPPELRALTAGASLERLGPGG